MAELEKKLRKIKEIFGKEVIFRIGITKKGTAEILSADNLKPDVLKGDENSVEGTAPAKSKEVSSYIG
jgi:CRISPR/Cas system-associated protein Cas5 (RAMP superfamily)|tara:strand:+ start:221 stop:424 length:204 start_codon:yes stop_codon:yes gene_type:complete